MIARSTKFGVLFGVAMLVAGPVLAADGPVIGSNLDEVIAKAKQEGTINIIWSPTGYGDESVARQHVANLNKMFGTNLTFRFSPGASMPRQGNQLLTEYRAGQTASSDLYITSAASLPKLVPTGLFISTPWTKLSKGRIPEKIVEGGGTALRLDTGITVVTYNTQLMPNPPTSMRGLLAAKYKGKLATTPYAAGFRVLLADDFWGIKKTLSFVKEFMPQVAGLTRCGEDERIATGEFIALAMDCTSQAPALWMKKGAPIDFFVPSDTAQKRYYYYTVPKNAAHPNAAVLMGLYLLSEKGQAAMWNLVGLDLDYYPTSGSGRIVKKYEDRGVKFKDITFEWWAKHPEIDKNRKKVTSRFRVSK